MLCYLELRIVKSHIKRLKMMRSKIKDEQILIDFIKDYETNCF